MKKQYVSALQEGDVVSDYFVAARKDLRDTQSGNKFLGMVFKDKTGEIGGVMWNNAVTVAGRFELGDVVNVRGTVNEYQKRLQVRVDEVVPLRDGEYDQADLMFMPANTDELLKKFKVILDTVKDEHLRKLLDSFFEDAEFMEGLMGCAAGKKWHHAYPGGLLQHCWEMARLAETLCELFPAINRDLLMTGVFIHDIGKIHEMSQGMHIEYTTAGKLVGHLEIGCAMANRKMDAIDGFPDDLRQRIIHMILSHHGELVMGSPIVPKTLEAIALAHIDNLDAQTDAFSRVIDETRERGDEWSEYITMIQRQIHRPPGE